MELHISILSKSECTELLKILPIVSLREIAISENKLAKKYILGFRPANAPVNLLASMYYQEIHLNNIMVKDRLQEIWDSYSEKVKLDEWLQAMREANTIEEYISVGLEYAKMQMGLNVSVLCKALAVDIETEKLNAIQRCVDEFKVYIDEIDTNLKSLEEKEEQDSKVIDKLKKEKESAIQKKDAAIRDMEKMKEESEKGLQKLRSELLTWQDKSYTLDESVKELSTLIDERSLQIEELNKIRLRLEENICLLRAEAEKKDDEIQAAHTEQEELVAKVTALQNERELEYARTISRLVEETIADLKVDYSLEIKQISEIMDNIDGSHDIISVWKHLSALNLEKVVDVEIAMSNDLVDIGILDTCDEIENNILLKYIILKSIKSLLFEFMSEKEKTKSLSERIVDGSKRE